MSIIAATPTTQNDHKVMTTEQLRTFLTASMSHSSSCPLEFIEFIGTSICLWLLLLLLQLSSANTELCFHLFLFN